MEPRVLQNPDTCVHSSTDEPGIFKHVRVSRSQSASMVVGIWRRGIWTTDSISSGDTLHVVLSHPRLGAAIMVMWSIAPVRPGSAPHLDEGVILLGRGDPLRHGVGTVSDREVAPLVTFGMQGLSPPRGHLHSMQSMRRAAQVSDPRRGRDRTVFEGTGVTIASYHCAICPHYTNHVR